MTEPTEQIRAEIEQTRAELADTVDALTDKLDVKGRAQARVAETKAKAADAAQQARPYAIPALVAVAVGVGILVFFRRRR